MFFLLVTGVFAAVEEWTPLGCANGNGLAEDAVTFQGAINPWNKFFLADKLSDIDFC
jgi:hypothetical protein